MDYNKFITTSGVVMLDLTEDTVEPSTLFKGVTAHDRRGRPIVGTMEQTGGGSVPEWDGSVTIIKAEYNIPSGWVTSANQGHYYVEGELTIDNTTVAFLEIALGINYGGNAGAVANYISIATENGWQSLDNTHAFTLKITGGKDASNADLLAWCESGGN